MKPATLAGIALLAVLVPACGDSGRVQVNPLPSPTPPTRAAYAKLGHRDLPRALRRGRRDAGPAEENVFDYGGRRWPRSACSPRATSTTSTCRGPRRRTRRPWPTTSTRSRRRTRPRRTRAALHAEGGRAGPGRHRRLGRPAAGGQRRRRRARIPVRPSDDDPARRPSRSTDAEAQSRLNAVAGTAGGVLPIAPPVHRRLSPPSLLRRRRFRWASDLGSQHGPDSGRSRCSPRSRDTDPAPALPPETQLCLRAGSSTGRVWYVFGNEFGLMTAPSVNSCEV